MTMEASFNYKININENLAISFRSFYNGEAWNGNPEGEFAFTPPNTQDRVIIRLTETDVHNLYQACHKITAMIDCVPNRLNSLEVDL